MIIGVGTDIVQIDRIAKNIKNQKFIDKVYTDNEKNYLFKKNYSPQTAAGIFAAKEAVSKALGTGISGFSITDIEIVKDKMDKPEIILYNNALKISENKNIEKINISISHEKDYAIAFAVAEQL